MADFWKRINPRVTVRGVTKVVFSVVGLFVVGCLAWDYPRAFAEAALLCLWVRWARRSRGAVKAGKEAVAELAELRADLDAAVEARVGENDRMNREAQVEAAVAREAADRLDLSGQFVEIGRASCRERVSSPV